ncbi:methyltransferase [Telluria mixta]|uniref:Methyltransferase n=1 Tax=Telluria mixta TaxID=34071 RepID=A0ABT2C739_9BURK|nr:CmcJ/NvfI family oxidoreductase [Telluria mixta]MCS0633179.1 methyltransferase [Telluria mixta]WEM94664.1 CmcJ/NvfI family oxidoreductase [Telluria mixta]
MQPTPVSATLQYLQSAEHKPVTYMLAPPGGHTWDTGCYASTPVTIIDGRGKADAPALDREGFQLCSAPSAMRSFGERDAIQRVYYREMEELARAVSGARHAIVFDHLVRRRDPETPTPFGARNGQRPGTATRVHCDFTPASAQRRLAIEMEAHGIRSVSRHAIVNLWRSTGLPVLDAPLAVCDARTVAASDLVAADIVYPTRTGEIFEVLHNPAHAWTYYHAMQFDEVLVFKQYDSQDGMSCFTPHAAFAHPDTPPGTPPRESIEIRCLLTFD